MSVPSVLLVGAYERENFGDLLFLLQTQAYLGGRETTASAPFPADMNALIGRDVVGYVEAARQGAYDAVWVVGGEVGGTSVRDAFRMSASDADHAAIIDLDRRARAAFLEARFGLDAQSSPYLPRMSAMAETFGTTAVINSVGLSGLRGLRGARRDEAWNAVREAAFVSVRDRDSSQLLTKHGIEHVLAPDFVHTLPLTMQRPPVQERLALVQVKENVLRAFGTLELARVLADSRSLREFDVRLFSAGSARGHDSAELYEQVAEHFRRLAPGRSITMSTSLDPMDKAREIASSGLWIGTSLHGLIISSAFDVPRVALELDKLVRYAETWDETMPHGVALGDLDAAVEAALALSATAAASGRSADLARQAHASTTLGMQAVAEAGEHKERRIRERSVRAADLRRRRSSMSSRFWALLDR